MRVGRLEYPVNLIQGKLFDKRLHLDPVCEDQIQYRRVVFRNTAPVALHAGVERHQPGEA